MTSAVLGRVEIITQKSPIQHENDYLEELKNFLAKITPATVTNSHSTDEKSNQDWIKSTVYYFTVGFGFFKNFLESYISLKVTLESFNFLKDSLINSISLAFGFLNLVLFYAFEVSLVRESLNIETSVIESVELLHLIQQQLQVAKDIHYVFFNKNNDVVTKLEEDLLREYEKFINNMNQSFNDKIKQQPLSLPKQIIKYSLFILGALSSVVGEYFVSQYMLEAMKNLVAISETVHWILTSLWLIYVLVAYIALSGSSVINLIHPELSKFKELNTEFEIFKNQIKINEKQDSLSPLVNV